MKQYLATVTVAITCHPDLGDLTDRESLEEYAKALIKQEIDDGVQMDIDIEEA